MDTPKSKLRDRFTSPDALKLIPEAMARKYIAFPLAISGNVLTVAIANPQDIFALEALATQSQMRIEPEAASAQEIQEAIDFNYKAYDEIEKRISSISLAGETDEKQLKFDTSTDSPVAQALNLIIDEAVKSRASDIHIQPREDSLRIRYRIDGTLRDVFSLPVATATPLISRIKVLAGMNIADHHRSQDGHLSVETKGRLMDIRVATTSTIYGEMAALRLLDKSRATMTLEQLGFLPESLAAYQNMLKVPYGMILVSGPTGAGKTTTLYASINTLDSVGKNIITIEDPVEYRFRNINQIQINPRAGITFAAELKAMLRFDPNVILVGEIRDAETARIAVQAALTGHVMLSTIHANDAVGVIFRLLDLGIEPFLLCSALTGAVSQRMAKRVCPECARPISVSLIEKVTYTKETGEERSEFLYGAGCKKCAQTGYSGRVGLFEILRLSDEIRLMILNNAPAAQLRAQAIKDGMIPLMKDGMAKVKAGMTTPSEVLRIAYSAE